MTTNTVRRGMGSHNVLCHLLNVGIPERVRVSLPAVVHPDWREPPKPRRSATPSARVCRTGECALSLSRPSSSSLPSLPCSGLGDPSHSSISLPLSLCAGRTRVLAGTPWSGSWATDSVATCNCLAPCDSPRPPSFFLPGIVSPWSCVCRVRISKLAKEAREFEFKNWPPRSSRFVL